MNKNNSTLHSVWTGCSTCPGAPQMVMLPGCMQPVSLAVSHLNSCHCQRHFLAFTAIFSLCSDHRQFCGLKVQSSYISPTLPAPTSLQLKTSIPSVVLDHHA